MTTIIIIAVIIGIVFMMMSSKKNKEAPKEETKIEIIEEVPIDDTWKPKEKFYKRVLLNKEETKVFNALLENSNNFQIFPQVSIGEIIGNKNRSDYSRINQKRADFCIVNEKLEPIAVIEYHGSGHNKGNYQKRDEVKQIAVESAGLIYHSILEKDLNNIENHIKEQLIPKLQTK